MKVCVGELYICLVLEVVDIARIIEPSSWADAGLSSQEILLSIDQKIISGTWKADHKQEIKMESKGHVISGIVRR